MKTVLRISVLTLLFVSVGAFAQTKPGIPPPAQPAKPAPAPILTTAESEALASLQADFGDLEKQRQEIVTKQQAVGAKYQKFAEAVAQEHPGFMLGPNGTLVEQPKAKEEPKK